MGDPYIVELENQIERLQKVVYKLAGWAGADIGDLIEDGYLEEDDLD